MARAGGSDPRADGVGPRSTGAAIPDLHARMQRAARGLGSGEDLSMVLAHLRDVIGEGTGIVRVALAVGGDEEPRELAAAPGAPDSPDGAPRSAALVREVHARGGGVAMGPDEAVGSAAGTDRARFGVPIDGEDRILAVLVGETRRGTRLEDADEVAVEAMATLLSPLLLVHHRLDDARELDRLRSDFVSRISHELRTPLTIITGFARTLGAFEDSLTEEQRHEMVDRILTASVRLEHLVEDVLSLASVDAGLAEPKPRLVPLRDLVDLAVHDRGGTGRIEVVGPGTLKLVTDPGIARAVLGPLIENALQHADRVRVTLEEAPAGVRVVVEDDGPGVPPELGARIFERFVRGDDRSPGMGVGLAIARRMAEAIDGRVWLEEVASGARFVAELRTLPTEGRRGASGAPPGPRRPSRRSPRGRRRA